MGRHKGYHPPKPETHDLRAMFVETGQRISRGAGILDAYRMGTGLLFKPIRTPEAQRSLKEAADACHADSNSYIQQDWASAMQHAGKHAMLAYLGQWWTCSYLMAPPAKLAEDEQFFSRGRIAAIVENRSSVEAELQR